MFYQKRLIIFASLFSLAVVVDGIKFLSVGGPNIIDWPSIVHPAWVIIAITLLFVGIFFDRLVVWQTLFGIYFLVMIASLLNQYIPFTTILTYNCMLFNLTFATLYFFLSTPRSDLQT